MKQLNQILISFNELKDLTTAMAKIEKRLGKQLLELMSGNAFEKDGPTRASAFIVLLFHYVDRWQREGDG